MNKGDVTRMRDGKLTYAPEYETARRAPAVVCAVASRTQRLRAKLAEQQKETFTRKEIEDLLRDYIAPLPFESEFLSGKVEQVDVALKNYPVTPLERLAIFEGVFSSLYYANVMMDGDQVRTILDAIYYYQQVLKGGTEETSEEFEEKLKTALKRLKNV